MQDKFANKNTGTWKNIGSKLKGKYTFDERLCTFGRFRERRTQTVHVVTPVAVVAEQQLVLQYTWPPLAVLMLVVRNENYSIVRGKERRCRQKHATNHHILAMLDNAAKTYIIVGGATDATRLAFYTLPWVLLDRDDHVCCELETGWMT